MKLLGDFSWSGIEDLSSRKMGDSNGKMCWGLIIEKFWSLG